MSLGSRIRWEREKRDLTQRELAMLSNVSNATISRIESGKAQDVGSEVLRQLARALGVTSDYLLTAHVIAPDEVLATDRNASKLLQAYVSLRERDREQLLDFANYLTYKQHGRPKAVKTDRGETTSPNEDDVAEVQIMVDPRAFRVIKQSGLLYKLAPGYEEPDIETEPGDSEDSELIAPEVERGDRERT